MKKNELIENIKYIAIGFIVAYLLNFGLGIVLKTDLPIVAVVSESMTHDETTENRHYKYLTDTYGFTREEIDSWPLNNGFLKGDVLIVTNSSQPTVGDVIVYDIGTQKVPIVHRIVEMDGGIVTKGDHNPSIDSWTPAKIHGKAVFVIPFLGWPKLLLTAIFGTVF